MLGLMNEERAVIAVIGCGGKTTLIASLADEYSGKKVLITPTTKILPMTSEGIVLCTTQQKCLSHVPVKGIQCLGVLNQKTGKLEALRQDLLEEIIPYYELVLLEADGSCGLPCKGWLTNEPVIPPFCTHTLGVVTLNAVGKAANSDTVLRLPEFLMLTGLRPGETIDMQALSDMVCAENGMFRTGLGRQSLLVNVADSSAVVNLSAAEELLRGIEKTNPGRFACLAHGNARLSSWSKI